MSLPCRTAWATAAFAMSTRVRLAHFKNGNAELSADDLQLLDGGGTVNVGRPRAADFVLLFK